MTSETRARVAARAEFRGEYCRLRQSLVPVVPFHVNHVRPRQHGGDDNFANLAWSCFRCNAAKGPNLATIDSATDELVPLFNPRSQEWSEHFALVGFEIVGLTAIGRGTVQLLAMNHEERLSLRAELLLDGLLDT